MTGTGDENINSGLDTYLNKFLMISGFYHELLLKHKESVLFHYSCIHLLFVYHIMKEL